MRPASSRGSSRPSTTSRRTGLAEDERHATRLLRGARGRPRRQRRRDQAVLSPPRPRAPSRRQLPRPRRRGAVQGGRRGLRGALRPRAPAHLRHLRPPGPAERRLGAADRGLRQLPGHLRGVPGRRPSASGGAGRPPAATSGPWSSSLSPRCSRACEREVSFEAVSVCEHCRGNGAEPGTPIRTCETCDGAGQVQRVTRSILGQVMTAATCEACGGDGRIPERPCEHCEGAGRVAGTRTWEVDVPAGIEDGQRIRITGAGPRRRPGRRTGRPLRRGPGRPRRALRAPGDRARHPGVPAAHDRHPRR